MEQSKVYEELIKIFRKSADILENIQKTLCGEEDKSVEEMESLFGLFVVQMMKMQDAISEMEGMQK